MSEQSVLKLSESEFRDMRQLVLEHTGISLSSGKQQLVKRRFSPRLKELGLGSFSDYLHYFRGNTTRELPHFCNAITTNLTSFFREKHHFDFLEQEGLPLLLRRNAVSRKLRLWSAGCSTGQEAYCLAIVLDRVLPRHERWDVKILATDLDENCLRKGRQGLYPGSELEKAPAQVLRDYFTVQKHQQYGHEKLSYQVRPELKDMISFRKLNLLHDWPMRGKFDVIFCRNVFIYFDKDFQQRLLRRFSSFQEAGSYFFLGHSESVADGADCHYASAGKTIYLRTRGGVAR